MRTWSWTHDFESYLYWWPITGASIIRDAGKEKNKAIKGKSRRGRVTNLILTKLKGYSTTKKLQNYEFNFDCNLIAPSHRGPPNAMMHQEGRKEPNTGSNDGEQTSVFHFFTVRESRQSYVDAPLPPYSPFCRPCQADGCWSLMECSGTTVMTVTSDGCTRRHMSVLRSSNVRLKLLLCVNKEDRKWQFGSSNQECHSQLRPLPAPDTSHGLKRSRAWLLFFCHPLPVPSTPRPVFAGNFVSMPPSSRGRQNDVRKTRVGATVAHFLNAPIKHEACLVRLPRHPLSKSQPCLAEADVLS